MLDRSRRLAGSLECDVGPADTRIVEFGRDDQCRNRWKRRQKRFQQLLELGRQRGFGGIGAGAKQPPD